MNVILTNDMNKKFLESSNDARTLGVTGTPAFYVISANTVNKLNSFQGHSRMKYLKKSSTLCLKIRNFQILVIRSR